MWNRLPAGDLMNESRNVNQIDSSSDEIDFDSERAIPLDPRVLDTIGKALKAHYQEILSLPIPDSMLVLLAELEAKERGKR